MVFPCGLLKKNNPLLTANNPSLLRNNLPLLPDKAGLLFARKYFKKNLKKSVEIFGNMEFILYLCNVFER